MTFRDWFPPRPSTAIKHEWADEPMTEPTTTTAKRLLEKRDGDDSLWGLTDYVLVAIEREAAAAERERVWVLHEKVVGSLRTDSRAQYRDVGRALDRHVRNLLADPEDPR